MKAALVRKMPEIEKWDGWPWQEIDGGGDDHWWQWWCISFWSIMELTSRLPCYVWVWRSTEVDKLKHSRAICWSTPWSIKMIYTTIVINDHHHHHQFLVKVNHLIFQFQAFSWPMQPSWEQRRADGFSPTFHSSLTTAWQIAGVKNLQKIWKSYRRRTKRWCEEKKLCKKRRNCETQPPASIGWVALSSVVRCSFVVRPSPLISTIWCFRPYKPYISCEDMILATCQCQHIFCCWVEPSLLLSS
jgi:hypothetical protein